MFAKFAIATATAALLAMAAGQSANAQVISQKVPSGKPGSTTMQAPSVPTPSSSTSVMKVPRPTNGTMQAPAPRPAPAPAPQTQSLPARR